MPAHYFGCAETQPEPICVVGVAWLGGLGLCHALVYSVDTPLPFAQRQAVATFYGVDFLPHGSCLNGIAHEVGGIVFGMGGIVVIHAFAISHAVGGHSIECAGMG